MDFHQLKIFLEVARRKSFTRAAESSFLSQPTVSAHIKKLEDEVGTLLLNREKRELELTTAGKILFQYGQELLETKARALSAIQEEQRIVKGHLEIAASSVPGTYILPCLLQAFLREHPEVTFSVLLRDTEQVLHCVKDYSYELGLAGESGEREGLGQIKLMEDELILVSSPEIKLPMVEQKEGIIPTVALRDCIALPFLFREAGSATRMIFEKALKKQSGEAISLKVLGYLEGQEAIKRAARAGLGLTVISKKAVEGELKAGLLKGYLLENIPLKRSFYLVFRKKSIIDPLNKAFLQFTSQYFGHGSI